MLLLGMLVLLKSAGLALDSEMRFFLGDSASYLHSALTGWIPPDRSFLYGMLIRHTALATHSVIALILVQSAFGIVCAALLFGILRYSFAGSFAFSATLAGLLAVEPAQLFYERMMMAESAGTTALMIMIAAGFAWLRKPHWVWALVWSLAGALAVALRTSSLPVVLGFTALPLLVGTVGDPARHALRRICLHLLVAIAATVALHAGYKHLYGYLNHSRADYIADSGAFRLGLVAPLVTVDEVVRAGLPADLLDQIGPALRDPRAREAQIWQDDGLIARVRAASHGNAGVARKLASYALRGDPLGLVRMGWSTLGDYFDDNVVDSRIADDIGTHALDEDMLGKLRACCGYDARGFEQRYGPVAQYFRASTGWLTACYLGLIPLALFTILAQWRAARAAALLLGLTAIGMELSTALFSHIVSFRYLHPLAPIALLCIGALLAPLAAKRPMSATETALIT